MRDRRLITEAFVTLYRMMEGDIPDDYLSTFNFQYENGCESWLDIIPKVSFQEKDFDKVVEFFSYINPKFFPEKDSIEYINFNELAGGKGRRCTKGIISYR